MQIDQRERAVRQRIKAGDDQARWELIKNPLGFATWIANSAAAGHSDLLPDMIGAAALKLVEEAARFNPDNPRPFHFHVKPRLQSAVHRFATMHSHVVRLPEKEQHKLSHMFHAEWQLQQKLKRKPTRAEIAQELRITEQQITATLLRQKALYEPTTERENKQRMKDAESLPDQGLPADAVIMIRQRAAHLRKRLNIAADTLTTPQKIVVGLYYLHGARHTLRQIGKLAGSVDAWKTRNAALDHLREAIAA